MRNRLEKKSFIKLETLVLLEVIMAIYVTSVPFMLSFISEAVSARAGFFFFTEYLFYAIIFAIALLAGMEFPLTCHLIIESGYESGSVAGWVDSMDHIGACFGAFFPAIIILPFFGTPVTCFIMGFLKLIAVALLFMNLKLMASKKVQLLR